VIVLQAPIIFLIRWISTAPLSDLAITLRVDSNAVWQTGHRFTRDFFPGQRKFLGGGGFAGREEVQRWYFVAGVDVATTADAFTMVVLGDSITDGRGSTTDGNNRWPDILANDCRQAATQKMRGESGIGGNRLLLDGIARMRWRDSITTCWRRRRPMFDRARRHQRFGNADA